AVAWSPHHHGIMASYGGGTYDQCLHFWNTLTGQPVQCINTGSQVTNLAWSKFSSELASLAVSPDGETIVTAGGDETIRFWDIFSKAHSQKVSAQFILWKKLFSNGLHFFNMTFIFIEFFLNIYCDFRLLF
ncbi:hypothetical protein B7P43_G11644, partial [Cryptotermes secundus]